MQVIAYSNSSYLTNCYLWYSVNPPYDYAIAKYYKPADDEIPILTFRKSSLVASSLIIYLEFLKKEHSIGSEKTDFILSLN